MKTKKLLYIVFYFASAFTFIISCENASDPIDTDTPEPLRVTGTSFENILPTCLDNSFYVYFNRAVETCYTNEGPIITIDTLTKTLDKLTNDIRLTYHPINAILTLESNKKDVKVTIDNNFDDNTLYYLNLKLSRITGNDYYDMSYSFWSSSIAKIIIHGGPESNLKPMGDTIRYYKPGRKLYLSIPKENNNYIFNKWICEENTSIFSDLGISDTLSTNMLTLTNQNFRTELNFYPIYDKK